MNMGSRNCVPVSLLGYIAFVAFIYISGSAVSAKTIFLEENAPTLDEVNFMKKYGYLQEVPSSVSMTYTSQSIAEAVTRMQNFAGLPPTGYLDDETRKLFKRRRCGVKDIEAKFSTHRRKRYILQQGWGKKAITYRVINGTSTLPKTRVESLMKTGLEVWAPHGGLNFRMVDHSKADIEVSFASKDHGDGFPFDGPGRVVAHAFPPPHGAMHFDDDEIWGDNPSEDDEDITDFFAVAVHEIGHALGLSHSNVKASVMYPYYQVPVEKLHEDDIMGMQELYLKEDVHSPALEVRTESAVSGRSSLAPRFTKADSEEDENDVPDLCYTNYDTIQVLQGKIYVFEEEWMWVLSEKKTILEGYPKRFHEVFIGLPRHINVIRTIYEKQNGHIVVFSGRSYWEFSARFRLVKRGRITEYKIPQVPELTTVFISNYNNKTYLIEYERYWRYDEATKTMDRGYPKEMSAWRNVPYPVDAAIIWKGDTFFFRGPRFWRFDNHQIRAHQYYPLPTAQIWFPCPSTPDMMQYTTNDEP
ncbi:matrix metalloproteinase-25-like [Pararge aegeria]|uniref:Jg1019 protein n=3 Tax=Pararge aegeria TaxID=116150 RepID=A0A8S4SDF3_9NEOP|nr:matrix metalloproteinase-25-like [Pararge aegeria]CAH2266423.1 jg1019 [Pararge aegeria aegeria]